MVISPANEWSYKDHILLEQPGISNQPMAKYAAFLQPIGIQTLNPIAGGTSPFQQSWLAGKFSILTAFPNETFISMDWLDWFKGTS
jgi:hypothetical protein